MKIFFEEFKKFLYRGNAIQLAVGVVIGSSFTGIVNSLVNDVLTPVIGLIAGGFDFSNIKIHLLGDSYILIGSFIQNVIDFVIVAFVLFIVVRAMNRFDEIKNKRKPKEEEKAPEEPEDIKLLKSIDKELKKLNKK